MILIAPHRAVRRKHKSRPELAPHGQKLLPSSSALCAGKDRRPCACASQKKLPNAPPDPRPEGYRSAEAPCAIFYAAASPRGRRIPKPPTDGSVTKTGDLSKTACAEALLAVQYNCNNSAGFCQGISGPNSEKCPLRIHENGKNGTEANRNCSLKQIILAQVLTRSVRMPIIRSMKSWGARQLAVFPHIFLNGPGVQPQMSRPRLTTPGDGRTGWQGTSLLLTAGENTVCIDILGDQKRRATVFLF